MEEIYDGPVLAAKRPSDERRDATRCSKPSVLSGSQRVDAAPIVNSLPAGDRKSGCHGYSGLQSRQNELLATLPSGGTAIILPVAVYGEVVFRQAHPWRSSKSIDPIVAPTATNAP